MAAPKRKRDFSEFLNESGDLADTLSIPQALDLLFDKILHQLATSSLFSNSDHAPNIFIVYAHDNEEQGDAHDACVRTMISWLKKINAQILSDQSPMPLHRPRIEGTGAVHNILQNQICLLPAKDNDTVTPTATSVDKVIVCGSEVLERYYGMPSALAFIKDVVQICVDGADQSKIRDRVEAECGKPGFHHILTELAFLEFREFHSSKKHSMVPVMLSQVADVAPMQYLPIFDSTDVKLKLKSPAASDLHKLFFKLLVQLFPTDGDFIEPFQQCYESTSKRLNQEGELTRECFNNIVNRSISDAYQTYWARFCVAVRNGKLQAYTGKLGHDVAALRRIQDVQTTHKILKWVSPVPALERHGKFHNKGTNRLEGTCNWIIQDRKFLQWYESEGSELLVLCGSIGTGKTYCTSRVIDWVQEGLSTNQHSEGFAYFYCNKQDNASDDPCWILRNIIRQLAAGPWARTSPGEINTVHKAVYQLWEAANGPEGIISTFSQWEECLAALINTYPRTTIVLDALDECGEVEQKALIQLLVNLASPKSMCKPVKIFVSTRPEVLHKQHLDKYPAIQMEKNQHADDIALFVRTKITDHHRWSKMTTELQNNIADTLLEKSGDMFLFASLQIQQLLRCDTEPDLRECLAELPKSLEETYEELYRQATARGTDRKKLLDRALRWVLCAARPLTTDELLFAISQDFESHSLVPTRWDLDEEWLSNLCHDFLSLDCSRDKGGMFSDEELSDEELSDEELSDEELSDEELTDEEISNDLKDGASMWRLAHQAVAEFLEKSDWCNHGRANYQAGAICLTIMLDTFGESRSDEKCGTRDNFRSLEGLQCPCGAPLDAEESIHDQLTEPLAEYASHAWPIHLRALKSHEANGSDCLSRALQKFLGESRATSLAYEKWPLSWSLTALACAHNETKILERLLKNGAERNTHLLSTTKDDEVPPIIAAAIDDSKEAAEVVLKSGAEICSAFTRHHGHVLLFAIKSKSLKVLRLLLDHIRSATSDQAWTETNRGLSEVSIYDFQSEDTIRVMLEADVKVDTPLKDGTILTAALHYGWKDLVVQLLEQGADVNMRFKDLRTGRSAVYDDAVEASLSHLSAARRDQLDSFVCLLIDKPQTRVRARHVGEVCTFDRHELVLKKLLEHDPAPDLNETYTLYGDTTSALIEAVISGSEKDTQLLIEHNADVNLQVGGCYGDAIGAAFWTILNWNYNTPYPADSIIKALEQAGANLDNLTGKRLNIALAAAAHAGLNDAAQEYLERGANPNAIFDHEYTTALGAAAASVHPRAPDIIGMLLQRGANANIYFPTPSNGWSIYNRLALDFPLQTVLKGAHGDEAEIDYMKRLDTCLRSAEILVSEGAIWDIDFAQWRECLEKKAPVFSRQNVKSLNQLQQKLIENRQTFFQRDQEAVNNEDWEIKDAKPDEYDWRRSILRVMHEILRDS
ncbi:hypothetical protein KVR01_011737 [Diaporthe batatas]|uniref:uncharacterized protein n=1 Tax=Diaporthe batatas TaxID=748121 RepID=UPI001D0584ED|nr:uncharacterized protein KVR01_011737 [Diaporthe batatas]KAG8158615.1 hypothetical protein KVR01_011737 [Diaporthe batatas]